MGDILEFAVRGLPIGMVFGLLAVGLVLTYRTSGVFHLAFAAQAFVSAAVFFVVRKEQGWPLLPAALLSIGVVAPLLGLLLERGLFRHLRRAPPLSRTVVSLGLLVALPEILQLWLGDRSLRNPPPLWPARRPGDWLWMQGSRFVLDAGQMATVLSTVVVVVGLTLLLRRSALGLQMRAVTESSRMSQLSGVDADRVSGAAWALSSLLAGLTGVLIAPLFATLSSLGFFTLLVAALAAAVVGRLVSVPLALAGGIGLGVLQAVLAGTLPTDSVLATGLRPALPFVVLFVLLLVRPRPASDAAVADPLAGVDPPPPARTSTIGSRVVTVGERTVGTTVVVGGLVLGLTVLDAFWLGLVVSGLVLALVLLSFTVLTGMGGMLSLSQATFAAIGAFATARVVDATDAPVLGAMLFGALVAAVAGVALALPLLRLDGIYLTLATLAFALMFESVLVPLDAVSGGATPLRVPRPVIAGLDFGGDRAFFLLVVVLLAIVGGLVLRVQRGSTGRFLRALHGSESAAVAVGISPVRQRILAFALASGIAGFGGGVTASWVGAANYEQSFPFFLGLVWVVVIVTIGARSVRAAIIGGVAFSLLPELLSRVPLVPSGQSTGLAIIFFGLGALAYARHPEGTLEAGSATARRLVDRALARRRPAEVTPAGAVDPTGGDEAAETAGART